MYSLANWNGFEATILYVLKDDACICMHFSGTNYL